VTKRLNRIAIQWLSVEELAASPLLHDPRTLGIATLGTAAPLAAASHLPQAHLLTSVVEGGGPRVELWSGRYEARDEVIGPARCRHNGEVLFAAVSMPVSDTEDDALGVTTHAAYRSLLGALHKAGYPHLLRVWNSIPDINVDDAGLERYRRFNLQRYRAYQEADLPTHEGAPAACALGSFGGPLVLYCLASRTPPDAIENPRQVSAYQYPREHGPRAPNFSRAALWRGGDDAADVLFISGTASIVGHQTQHHGDVEAQTRETLANLQAVVEQARLNGARNVTALSDLLLKGYVRHADDLVRVKKVLREHGLDVDAIVFVQADICRADLLIEIEAIGPVAAVDAGEAEPPYARNSRYAGLAVSSQ
jgi:chorismate lyase / 3-hydroxybenzoate synthase